MSHDAPGWTIERHEALASTQDHAIAAAQAGQPAPLVILARTQSAGRGTQGRAWIAPPGNFSASVLLRPPGPPSGLWSLRIGVALHQAVAALLADPATLRLAWPNDLLLDGAKLAGILIDAQAVAPGVSWPRLSWIVAGIGVNLLHAPPLPDRRTACLAERGAPVLPDTLLAQLIPAIDRWSAAPDAAIIAAWMERGPRLGEPHRLKIGADTVAGGFAGLTEGGALRLAGLSSGIVSGERI